MWCFYPTQATDTSPPSFLKNKMNRNDFLKHSRYLSHLMSAAIKQTEPSTPFEGINWEFLIALAKKHDSLLMIEPALNKLSLPDEVRKAFNELKNFYLARIIRQNIEAENVLSRLEKQNIRYLKMKGSHIKDFYPDPLMRSFNDIDLLIDKENLLKAKPLMESLGYTLKNSVDYHDEYEKDSFYIYELHSSLVSKKEKYRKVFENPFEKAIQEKNSLGFKLRNEYLYLHLFFHLYNHFTSTGCGVRLFADFLVFREYIKDIDQKFIDSVIEKYKMTEFKATVDELTDYFFFGKEVSEKTEKIAEYIFTNETTGVYKFHVASFGFFGKIGFFLRNWFPKAKDLAFRYPVLEKHPVLLPVCWIRRIFYTLFFNRKAIKEQAESIKTVNSEEYKQIKEIRESAKNGTP